MDQFVRVKAGRFWKRNTHLNYLLNLHTDFIFDCKIDGEWNVSNERYITFLLRNHSQILQEEILSIYFYRQNLHILCDYDLIIHQKQLIFS